MKKFLKISGLIIAFVVVLMLILPWFFKDEIASAVKTEINKNVNATVDFSDFSLSLFRSFPDFSFGLEGLSVTGKGRFNGDTLAAIGGVYLELDLMSVFSGDSYSIKSIEIKNPKISAIILKDGTANYDIALDDGEEETAPGPEEDSVPFKMELKRFAITGARIFYDDREGNMKAGIRDLNMVLRGNFTESVTDLNFKTSIKSLTYEMDGMKYLNRAAVNFDAIVGANLDDYAFTFKENKLTVNGLTVAFDGKVAMPGSDIDMDLTFASQEADFKSILSLIPAIYLKDFEGLKAGGTAAVSGFVKGKYNDDSMPAFKVDVEVNKGMFQYPGLPKKVEDVAVKMEVNSPSPDMDKMVIDIRKLHLNMAGNPLDMTMLLKTPLSDPDVDMTLRGKLDLSKTGDFYPLDEGMKLSGKFDTKLALKARQSDIDKGRYSRVTASGFMKITGLNYTDADLPEGVKISEAVMKFNPRFVELASFKSEYRKQKIELTGRLTNYFNYWFDDGILKGNLTLKSDYLNINKILASSGSPAEEVENQQEGEEAPMEAVALPDNIDFTFRSFIGRIKYDKLNMNAVYGRVTLAESRLSLDDLKMEALGGTMNVNGFYSTVTEDTPAVALVLGLRDVNVKSAYKAFNTIRQLAPIAQYIDGDFSAILTYKSDLKKDMMPLLNTLNSEGIIKTSGWEIKGSPLFKQLASQLKYNGLNRLQAKPMVLRYSIEDGNLEVKPFDMDIDGIKATVSGSTNLDQSIDYKMFMHIPKSKLGSGANALINSLTAQAQAAGVAVSSSDYIDMDVFITGKAGQPRVKVLPAHSAQSAQDQLEDKVTEEINKAKKQAEQEAEKLKKQAEEAADSLKQEAQKKARQELDKAKAEAEKKKKELEKKKKEEEEKARKKLEEEAKKKLKGFF